MFKKSDIKLGLNDSNVTLSTIHISNDYKYMSLELINNTKQTIVGVSVRVIQKDKENNILGVTDFDYNDFICKANKRFLPKINIECNENLSTIDFELKDVTYKENEESNNVVTKNKKRPVTLCKRFVFLAIFILALIFCIAVFSFNYYYTKTTNFITDGTFKYENVNGGLEVVEYYKNDKNVTIPSSYNGRSVTSISDELFNGSFIETLTIEASTLEVGYKTFSECSSLSIVNANNLVLSEESFSYCTSLQEFNADIIGTIPTNCFSFCESLTSFTSKSASYVNSSAFDACNKLEEVVLPNATLKVNAFSSCENIKKVTYKKVEESVLCLAFPKVASFEEVSNYESKINLAYFYDSTYTNYLTITNLHLLNTSVSVDESLLSLSLSNYKEEDGNCYLDDAIVLYTGTSDVLNVNNSKMVYYTSVYKNSNITTLNLNVSCSVEDEFIDSLYYLKTINVNVDDVKINTKLSSTLTVNINSTGSKLSSILQDNTKATINICANIPDQFFDGTTQDDIVISSMVSSISSSSFTKTTSIEKLEVSDSSVFSGQIQGVYELDIANLTEALPTNDVKKIVVSESITEESVLKNSTSLIILDITPTLIGSSLSTLFGVSTNKNVPSSLETVYLRFSSVSSSYFQDLKYIKNIAIVNTNRIAYATIFDGCESLCNVYFKTYNSSIYNSLCQNLNSIGENLDHKINIISSSSLTSYFAYSYLNYIGNSSLDRSYTIKYDSKSYEYEGLFLSDLNHLIGVSDEYVVRTYTNQSYTNMVYCYTSNSVVYCLAKQYQTYSITSDNIIVTYYYGSKILNKVVTSSNLTLDYYFPDEISDSYFAGWYTNSSLTNLYSFNSTINSDLNLYAKYVSSSSYITDNQEVISIDDYLSTYTASNNIKYSYYQKYAFYAPTNGVINVMTIGNTDTFIDIINNSTTYSDDDSGIDSNASLSATVTNGICTIYVCSNSNSLTNLIFTYSPTSTLNIKMPSEKTVVYTFDALENEEYTISIDSFAKDGYTFLGIYTSDGYQVFDENGASTSYWLTYSQNVTSFVVKYDYNS